MVSPTAAELISPDTQNAQQKVNLAALRNLIAGMPLGQCRLTKSGSNLLLSRCNGKYLTINGELCEIPAAGVSLAPTGLTPSTLYYVYAYMSGATMTLEASTTGHSTNSTTGVETKTGDASRTLVGMARTIAGPAWQDSSAQRLVISWFNRRGIESSNAFASDKTTASPSYTGLGAERAEFLTWGDEVVRADATGTILQGGNVAGNGQETSLSFDGSSTPEDVYNAFAYSNNPAVLAPASFSLTKQKSGLSEGYHYLNLLGRSPTSTTSTWKGSASAGSRCTFSVLIQG